jgi:hypothetical protein
MRLQPSGGLWERQITAGFWPATNLVENVLFAGLYARVSTNDQQTVPLQIRAPREDDAILWNLNKRRAGLGWRQLIRMFQLLPVDELCPIDVSQRLDTTNGPSPGAHNFFQAAPLGMPPRSSD